MKLHTTNYLNTFIEVADDCKETQGILPPQNANQKTIASIQYELLAGNPYKFSSDDIIFEVFALKKGLNPVNFDEERKLFFSKGQPCLRTSPLCKRYGWGIHCDEQGKIALYGRETSMYKQLSANPGIKKTKAMRSK